MHKVGFYPVCHDGTVSTLLAFDTSYVYFRSFFGVPDRFKAADGTSVNAVRGTLDAIARLTEQYRPTHLACAWDDDWRPAWRVELVPSYKSHRVARVGPGGEPEEEVPEALAAQVPLIRECLETLGIAPIGVANHEADDVLGSLATHYPGRALVVTGDRDLFQLADASTRVVYIGRGVASHELVDPAWLEDAYSMAAGRYVDFSVLRGDPSDGLPGVKGVGEKTAAQLVRDHPTLEAMLEAAADPGSGMAPGMRNKLLAAADYLPAARRVVEVVTSLELPEPAGLPTRMDAEHARVLGEKWNLGGSMERAIEALSAVGVEQVDR